MQRQMFRVATRGFFKSAAPAAARAPLKLQGLSGEYAHSILDVCVENKVDTKYVSEKLNTWVGYYDANVDLRRFMADDEKNADEKAVEMEEHIFEEMGLAPASKAPKDGPATKDELVKEAITMLTDDGEIDLMADVAADFEKLMLDHVREVKCVVTTAVEPTSAQKSKIEKKVKTMIAKDEKANFDYQLDESILGGLTLTIGDKYQDLSARGSILTSSQALATM